MNDYEFLRRMEYAKSRPTGTGRFKRFMCRIGVHSDASRPTGYWGTNIFGARIYQYRCTRCKRTHMRF